MESDVPVHDTKAHGEVEVYIYSFLTFERYAK